MLANALKAKLMLHGLLLACLGLVAVAYSPTSELSLMTTSKGDLVAETSSDAADDAVAKRTRINSELDSTGVVRASAEIKEELDPPLTNKRRNSCQGWLPNARLRGKCIDEVPSLQRQLGKYNRWQLLEMEPPQKIRGIDDYDPGFYMMH